jgi:hypothetical protein
MWIYLWKIYAGDEIKFFINDFPVSCYNEDQWEVERQRISYAVLCPTVDVVRVCCWFVYICVRLTYDIFTFIFINSWNWYFN